MEDLINYDQRFDTQSVLVFAAFLFLIGGLVCLVLVLTLRVWKSATAKKAQACGSRLRSILNDLVVTETLSQAHRPKAAVDFRVDELKSLQRTSFAKQVLLNQVIDMKRNLSGNGEMILKALYIQLKLYEISLDKLKSLSPYRKARGIRELSVMGYTAAHKAILKYVVSANRTIREEAILASLQLSPHDPLAFLVDYRHDIILWMRIQIHHYLQRLPKDTLPDFTKWFGHSNITIVLFAVSMVRAFRQSKSASGLVALLEHPDERVVASAIETLAVLEAFQFSDIIAALAEKHFGNRKISRRIAHCLGVMGSAGEHGTLLLRFANHDDYEVRFSALRSLIDLGFTADYILENSGRRPEEIEPILAHLYEPLLN